jgi:hypothetical protein
MIVRVLDAGAREPDRRDGAAAAASEDRMTDSTFDVEAFKREIADAVVARLRAERDDRPLLSSKDVGGAARDLGAHGAADDRGRDACRR